MIKTRLILHVGQHKTGSKALQAFLFSHRKALSHQGFLYPVLPGAQGGVKAYHISHYRLFALMRRQTLLASGNPAAADLYWAAQDNICKPLQTPQQFFDECIKQCRRHGCHTMILSAEDLFDMSTAHELDFSLDRVRCAAEILKSLAGEFELDPFLVAYVRRQDHLLCAHYGQFIKGDGTHDIELAEFSRHFSPRLKTRDILAQWAAVFGSARLQVRPYEACQLPKGIIPDFFENTLGLAMPEHGGPAPLDIETSNISPTRDYIEFLRLLNRHREMSVSFSRKDVLLAAVLEQEQSGLKAHTAEWMSPAEQRALVEYHAADNAAIAAEFIPHGDGHLFCEELPRDDAGRPRYPGLSAVKTLAIAARANACRRQRQREKQKRRKRVFFALILTIALSALGAWLLV